MDQYFLVYPLNHVLLLDQLFLLRLAHLSIQESQDLHSHLLPRYCLLHQVDLEHHVDLLFPVLPAVLVFLGVQIHPLHQANLIGLFHHFYQEFPFLRLPLMCLLNKAKIHENQISSI